MGSQPIDGVFNVHIDCDENPSVLPKDFVRHQVTANFHEICLKGNLTEAVNLYEFSRSNNQQIFSSVYQKIFEACLYSDQQHISEWLYFLRQNDSSVDITVTKNNDEIFKNCCNTGNEKTVKWLCNLEPRYSYNIINNRIYYKILKLRETLKNLVNHKQPFNEPNLRSLISEFTQNQVKCHRCSCNPEYYVVVHNSEIKPVFDSSSVLKTKYDVTVCLQCYYDHYEFFDDSSAVLGRVIGPMTERFVEEGQYYVYDINYQEESDNHNILRTLKFAGGVFVCYLVGMIILGCAIFNDNLE
jgi:hypothetical protein